MSERSTNSKILHIWKVHQILFFIQFWSCCFLWIDCDESFR